MGKLTSVRADRTLSRSGLFATGPRQLTLPIEARGLSEIVIASGSLRVTPDYDVLAWLCERWLTRPTESGWMRPTFYEIGSDLYALPPSGTDYRTLTAALDRLGMVTVSLTGYDAETGEATRHLRSRDNLASVVLPGEDTTGTDRFKVRLAEWLRREISDGAPVRLSWRTLRAFDENQKLAKRLWIYLAAERWRRSGTETEGTWIACGDRLFAALGMDYAEPKFARRALKRACQTIRRVDARYAAGELQVVKTLGSWKIISKRPRWEAWRELRAEHEQARQAITASLRRAA